MLCKKCGKKLTGKQEKFCSEKCSKLFLKAEYRKRNRDKVNAYNRTYRKLGLSPLSSPLFSKIKRTFIDKYKECLKCGSTEIQIAHVKPLWAGGDHRFLLPFCQKHHYQFDLLLKDFWKS